LQSFYEEPTQEPQDELQARIEELEMQLAEAQEQKSTPEGQLELLERSYEIAARYMQDKEHPQSQPDKEPTVSTNSRKITVRPMPRATREVVSHLAAPISDSTLMTEFSQPRNSSFNTLADDKELSPRTAIRAAVYRTTTISDGDDVALRLLEDVIAGASIIPVNSIVVGMARITQGRVQLSVSSIHHNSTIIPVELSAYDLDGVEGIAARGTEELSAIKEIAADMGSGMGSSITITDDAGTQLLSDMGRSVIQGTSQYISQKMRTVRITLKNDYMVLLQPPID
jgi:conjugative transposon TraM protein